MNDDYDSQAKKLLPITSQRMNDTENETDSNLPTDGEYGYNGRNVYQLDPEKQYPNGYKEKIDISDDI